MAQRRVRAEPQDPRRARAWCAPVRSFMRMPSAAPVTSGFGHASNALDTRLTRLADILEWEVRALTDITAVAAFAAFAPARA